MIIVSCASRRAATLLAVLFLSVLLVSCSSSKQTPAVVIGDLPDDLGLAISLDRDLDPYGAFTKWPSACELVTDDTLTALLPQIQKIESTPEAAEYEVVQPDLTKVPGGTISVPEARCTKKFTIGIGFLEQNPGTLDITVVAAGSKEFVTNNVDRAQTTKFKVKGGTCGDAADGIRCVDASGRLHFRLTLQLPHHGKSLKDPSRYDDGGEVRSFTTDKPDVQPREDYLNERLTRPIVQSILTRLDS
ncbi:MAG: hypothetical protein L0G99_08265 [Propionibacteriales bacterium]|nr:hypothetical protein [Propionibacteriales bacterium]